MKTRKMMIVLAIFMAVISMACEEVCIEGESLECETGLDCDDGDYCTYDYCHLNTCTYFANPACVECETDLDCMDDDPCTWDTCMAHTSCVHIRIEDTPECNPECDSHEDCDDGDACTVDVCGFDGKCVHEDVERTRLFFDGDGDGYGNAAVIWTVCSFADMPPGYVTNADDCDDGDAAVHPGADEVCNEVDDDCDGIVDYAECQPCSECGGCALTVTSLESSAIVFTSGLDLLMLHFRFEAHRDIEIRQMSINLGTDCNGDMLLEHDPVDGTFDERGGACGSPSETLVGFFNDADGGEILVDDIKITRADSIGSVLMGPASFSNAAVVSDGYVNGITIVNPFYMSAGDTYDLAVRADVRTSSWLRASIDVADIVLYDIPSECIGGDALLVGEPRQRM